MVPGLDDLGQKLDLIHDKREAEETAGKNRLKDAENMTRGLRAGVELIAPMIAGGLIGWGLDNWFGTKPVFLIIVLLLGVAAGFVNVWRTTQNIGGSVGFSELHKREKDAKTLRIENDQ